MSVFGKSYNNEQSKHKSFNKMSNSTKTIIGLALSAPLAYVSYKYGYSLVGHAFDFSQNNVGSIFNEILFWGSSVVIGAMVGFFAEGFRTIDSKDSTYHISNGLKYSTVIPVISLATMSYFEPSSTEFLLNMAAINAKALGGSTLALAASAGLVSPIFSKQIGHKFLSSLDKLKNMNAFSSLTEKFNQYFTERENKKLIKKNQQNIQTLNQTNPTSNDTQNSVIQKIVEVHSSLSNMATSHMSKYNIGSNIHEPLADIFNKSTYILKNTNLETLEYKQEVLSLYGNILPNIINSYISSLENANDEEKRINRDKLRQSLLRIGEHFGRIENVLRENQKAEKNMDFDSAINFADARFKLIKNDEQNAHQKTLKTHL